MKKALFTALLCTFSLQASVFYAADGTQYNLDNCRKECLEKLALEGPDQVNNILQGTAYQEYLSRQVLNKYLENKDLESFDSLYKTSSTDDEWIMRNRHSVEFEMAIEDSDDAKIDTAIAFIRNNQNKTHDNYSIAQSLGKIINEQVTSELGLSEDHKAILNTLDMEKKIDLGSIIQDVAYYNDMDFKGLYEVLPFARRQKAVCEHVDERVMEFDEFFGDDCYEYEQCQSMTNDKITEMKESFKDYLNYSCDGNLLIDNIESIRENANEAMSYMFEDGFMQYQLKAAQDECYDCSVQKFGDYISISKLVKSANRIIKITSSWSENCDENQDSAVFYNLERRALNVSKNHENINYIHLETRNDRCKIKFEAKDYRG